MVREERRFEAIHSTLVLSWPAPRVTVVTFSGKDTNELGDAPFLTLDAGLLENTELFIDARKATSASIDVSAAWALWLRRNNERFAHVSMLTGSRFIAMSADQVKRFAELGERMRLYTDAVAFDQAVELAIASAGG